jgi:hypothetical protein
MQLQKFAFGEFAQLLEGRKAGALQGALRWRRQLKGKVACRWFRWSSFHHLSSAPQCHDVQAEHGDW